MNRTHAWTARNGPVRSALSAGWRFTRHLFTMIVAMLAGMLVLGIAIAVLGNPPGYEFRLVEYGYMALSMSVPMVAWMRRVGHPWADCWEMVASMVAPMYALVVAVELGLLAMTPMALMLWTHLAMVSGMLVLMLYRWEVYANGAHCHRPANTSGTVTDPVCGMLVDPATTAYTSEHQGKTYHFCAPGCRKAFERQPDKFLAPDYVPSM